jgi:sugar phosphate isomerase/epimerase
MKLGFLTALFQDKSLDEVLEIIRPLGLETIEFPCGNYPGSPHLDVDDLLKSKNSRTELMDKLKREGLEISALSCHGNVLHPDSSQQKKFEEVQNKTIQLAEKLKVKTVNDFSGCPGTDDKATRPSWITCPWPPDFIEALDWQWEKKVIPYWTKKAKYAADHGVRIAFEAHPGFVVYNTETLLRIRKECGNNLGANFDPSHFFWQGMEPIDCIRALGGKAIFHVHAKDSKVYEQNARINGVLDNKHYGDEINRSWIFRTCGYGHGYDWWNDFVSTLRMIGYDGPISIEHEDSLMSPVEGLTKAVDFLQKVLVFQKRGTMTWA